MNPEFFGQYLFKNGYITKQQLFDALNYQHTYDAVRIGEIAIQSGLMTDEEAKKVNLEQRRKDKFFGELAVIMGFINQEQLERIITIQRNSHIYLGEALIDLEIMTRDGLEECLIKFHDEQKPLASLENIIPPELEIHNAAFVLLDVSAKIFRRMAELQLKVGKGGFITEKIKNSYLISSIFLRGAFDLKYFINMPRNVAETIARNLYGKREIKLDDETISDCVGELANVICGNACSQILEFGQRLYLSPPENHFRSEITELPIDSARKALTFPASVPIGDLQIGLEMARKRYDRTEETTDGLHEHTILIVDDSELSCQQLRDIVDFMPGFSVVGTASNGIKAIEEYQALKPDIVLMDLIIPEMPGEEVIRRIRQLDEHSKIIVISSIGSSADTILKELIDGAIAVIPKPIDVDIVKKAIIDATV